MKTTEEIIESLKFQFPEGSTVFAVQRGHNATGTRYVDFIKFVQRENEQPFTLCFTRSIAEMLSYRYDKNRECISLKWNNGTDVVESLAYKLYGNTRALNCEVI